ncbi:MAG: hypothetical protein HZA17_04190 [Nitrospirae bacterium]|nr:hypothetical protein [Nitrospirota bacterium]
MLPESINRWEAIAGIVVFVTLFFAFVWPLAYLLYRSKTDFGRGTNDNKKARNFIKSEIDRAKSEYELVCGMTAPKVLHDVFADPAVQKKLQSLKVKMLIGPTACHDSMEKSTAFWDTVFNNKDRFEVYCYRTEPPQHFRICDDDYAYLEDKHEHGQTVRPYSIYEDPSVVFELRKTFDVLVKEAQKIDSRDKLPGSMSEVNCVFQA